MTEHITDHEGIARDRLADQFNDKTRLLAVLDAFSEQVQAIEDALWDCIDGRTIQHATGATLDTLGEMVGQPRSVDGPDATDDEAYRALIYGRIIVNTGYGTPETVYAFLRQVGATGAWISEIATATAHVEVTDTLLLTDDGLADILVQATPPINLTVVVYHPTEAFGFDGDPTALGFGEGELARRIL
jgi:hypothetical protein